MLKLTGIISVFIPCVLFGLLKAHRLKKRCESLRTLKLALERFGVELSFTKKRLERILTEISREFSLPVFYDTALNIKKLGLKNAWSKALEKYAEEMALSDADIKVVLGIGDLSNYSGEEQGRCIDTVIRLLEISFVDAQEVYSKTGRLFKSSGILVGLLAVILLI